MAPGSFMAPQKSHLLRALMVEVAKLLTHMFALTAVFQSASFLRNSTGKSPDVSCGNAQQSWLRKNLTILLDIDRALLLFYSVNRRKFRVIALGNHLYPPGLRQAPQVVHIYVR